MICPGCGHDVSEGLRECPECGAWISGGAQTPAVELVTQTAGPVRSNARRRPWALLCGIPIILVVALASVAYVKLFRSASVYDLVPSDSAILISADTRWWAETMGGLPKNRAAIQAFGFTDISRNLSFDRDIAPWIGRTCFSVGPGPSGSLGVSMYLQVRHTGKLIQVVDRLKKKMGGKETVTTKYHGVPVVCLRSAGGISWRFAMVGRWVVAGDDASVQGAIDCYQGRRKPIARDKGWQPFIHDLREDLPLYALVDGSEYWRVMSATGAPEYPAALMDRYRSRSVFQLAPGKDDLRLEGKSVAVGEQVKREWRLLHGEQGLVGGRPIPNCLDGAVGVLFASSPDGWAQYAQNSVARTAPALRADKGSERALRELKSLSAVLHETNRGLTFSLGALSETLRGASVVACSTSQQSARKAAARLAEYARSRGSEATLSGGVYNSYYCGDDYAIVVDWSAKGSDIVMTSDMRLFDHVGHGRTPAFPADADGADAAALLDMRRLPSALQVSGKPDRASALWRSGCDTFRIVSWLKVSEDGGSMSSVLMFEDPEWRKSLPRLAEGLGPFILSALKAD